MRNFEDETPARDQIEVRAYEIYLQRGAEDGHALEDWLTAERQLNEEPAQRRLSSAKATAAASASGRRII